MNKTERKRNAQLKYRSCRELPIWDVIGLENQGILNWKFRPKYMDLRIKRAIRPLWQGAIA